jgi:uncharacterized SAM-binding protein YcdF (DUF218 family)
VPILCSGGGTPHRPPLLGARGHVVHEGTACCAYLARAHGVKPSFLLKESSSYDTLGNAWFSLTQHALPAGWAAPLVVTSAFHMPRSRAAFEWVFGLADAEGADASLPLAPRFLSTPDGAAMSEAVRAARAAREADSLAALRGNAARVRTRAAFHAWINGGHKCYAVARQEEWEEEPPAMADAALASY